MVCSPYLSPPQAQKSELESKLVEKEREIGRIRDEATGGAAAAEGSLGVGNAGGGAAAAGCALPACAPCSVALADLAARPEKFKSDFAGQVARLKAFVQQHGLHSLASGACGQRAAGLC